jgi:hypothetical protein
MSNEDNKRMNAIAIPISIEFFNFSPPCLMIDYSRIDILFGQMTFGRKIGGNGTKSEHNYGAYKPRRLSSNMFIAKRR